MLITQVILTLLPHLSPPIFWIFSFPPISYRPPTSSVQRCIPFLWNPLPTSSPGMKHHPSGRHLHRPIAGVRRSSLRPASRLCVCRCVLPVTPPLYCPYLAPRSLSAPGGVHPLRVPPHLCASALSSCCSTVSRHLLMFGSSSQFGSGNVYYFYWSNYKLLNS